MHFNRVLMANGFITKPLVAHVVNDGVVFSRMSVAGRTGDNGSFSLQIELDNDVRRLTARAADVGERIRAIDMLDTMQDGTLSVASSYDDARPWHRLSGIAEINGFRLRQAAALGRLLQAMTLCGLADVLRGPGLSFARLVAPFDGVLELTDARAFSPSLGLTVKGRTDMVDGGADLRGTIVAAYFFNSPPGKMPLVGRLFSPERGGGVFAASYAVRGKLGYPEVEVIPLPALTPGFFGSVFGIF